MLTDRQAKTVDGIMYALDVEFCKQIKSCSNCPCLIESIGCIRDLFSIILTDNEENK